MLKRRIRAKSLEDAQEKKCLEEKLGLRAQKMHKSKNAQKKNRGKSQEDVEEQKYSEEESRLEAQKTRG